MNNLLILLVLGIWIGLLLGLSFIEAPLKFQAPGITTILGLGIGRLVFGVLNKIEIVFLILLIGLLAFQFKNLSSSIFIFVAILSTILLIQSVFLLPVLDERAQSLIAGNEIQATNHHLYFVILEVSKLITLVVFFLKTPALLSFSLEN